MNKKEKARLKERATEIVQIAVDRWNRDCLLGPVESPANIPQAAVPMLARLLEEWGDDQTPAP